MQTHDEIAPTRNQPTHVPFISNDNVPNNNSRPASYEELRRVYPLPRILVRFYPKASHPQ